jgi:two-component system, chemotaxis family, chemotaxis protein CheY
MPASVEKRSFRILLIDNDAALRSSLAQLLRAVGHQVETQASGPLGLMALKAANYDVVITDVFMPDVDGVEITRTVRRLNPDCRVIGISGGCARMSAAIGLQMVTVFGADRVLYKPFSGEELIAAITFETGLPEKGPLPPIGTPA